MKGITLVIFMILVTTDAWAQDKINEICKSSKPILVVDDFSLEPQKSYDVFPAQTPYMDFDGDGIPDGSHGDLVLAICKSTGKRCLSFNIPQRRPSRLIPNTFLTLQKKIESGEIEKPIALNISAKLRLDIENVNSLGLNTVITPDNLSTNKNLILAALLKSKDADLYVPLFEIFKKFNSDGISIVTTSGNEGSPSVFNFYSLMPGAITVGAVDIKGQRAPYSNFNSLTTVNRLGDFFGREVNQGIDINGDQTPEFLFSDLSHQSPIVKAYVGRSLIEAVTPLSDFVKSMRTDPGFSRDMAIARHIVNEGLYKDSDFLPDGGTPEERAKDEYIHVPSHLLFNSQNGKIIYNPAADNDPSKVIDWHGTSFAAPNLCQASPMTH